MILQSGLTATGIQVPEEVVEALGAGRRPAVKVTVNGYTYRSTVAVMGGAYMISLSAEHRAAGGEEVDVDLDLDTAPREVSVPADFAAALDAEPAARRTFDGLSYSNRSWHVLQVEGAKTEQTRQRRPGSLYAGDCAASAVASAAMFASSWMPCLSSMAVAEMSQRPSNPTARSVPPRIRLRMPHSDMPTISATSRGR